MLVWNTLVLQLYIKICHECQGFSVSYAAHSFMSIGRKERSEKSEQSNPDGTEYFFSLSETMNNVLTDLAVLMCGLSLDWQMLSIITYFCLFEVI